MRTAPAIGSDGTIYVGSLDHKIYAISADGSQQWVWATAGEVNSSPAIGPDGTVYLGSNDCKLYALFSNSAGLANSSWPMFHRDLKHQSRMFDYLICWTFATSGFMRSSPAIGPDGTIYVGSNDKKVYALRPNGTDKWRTPFTTRGEVESSPAVGSDGTIYVGSYDSNFYAIYPDGTQKWSQYPRGPVHSSPAVAQNGNIYVGSDWGYLYPYSPEGIFQWPQPFGAVGRCGRPRPSAPMAPFTSAQWTNNGNVYAVKPDGTAKWAIPSPPAGRCGRPRLSAPMAPFTWAQTDYRVYAINPDGSQKWKTHDTGYVESSPAVGPDGTVYVGSNYGRLYALDPQRRREVAFPNRQRRLFFPGRRQRWRRLRGVQYRIYAVNPNGTLKWSIPTNLAVALPRSSARRHFIRGLG